jgi:hypothetical protein
MLLRALQSRNGSEFPVRHLENIDKIYCMQKICEICPSAVELAHALQEIGRQWHDGT